MASPQSHGWHSGRGAGQVVMAGGADRGWSSWAIWGQGVCGYGPGRFRAPGATTGRLGGAHGDADGDWHLLPHLPCGLWLHSPAAPTQPISLLMSHCARPLGPLPWVTLLRIDGLVHAQSCLHTDHPEGSSTRPCQGCLCTAGHQPPSALTFSDQAGPSWIVAMETW